MIEMFRISVCRHLLSGGEVGLQFTPKFVSDAKGFYVAFGQK